MPPEPRTARLQTLLLDWFATAQRDLPWRRTRDPYAIWLSEVMLQQTQVVTVIPYWKRYLERFPTVEDLARAPLDDVLALWSGLGYYARARNLHRAANAVVERHEGRFPADVEALRDLPGFGPYTAGAVASIAFDLDAALVDGNVARVLCRVEGWEVDAERARTLAWELAPCVLPKGRARDWNQALMELGATVCLPRKPDCARCPVQSICRAARSDTPALYPLPKKRAPRKRLRFVALCAVDETNAVALTRNETEGLFGGLWTLPLLTVDEEARLKPAASSLAHSILGIDAPLQHCSSVTHTLTHRDVVVEVFRAQAPLDGLAKGCERFDAPSLTTIGLSTLAVKMLSAGGVMVPRGHGRRTHTRTKSLDLFGDTTP